MLLLAVCVLAAHNAGTSARRLTHRRHSSAHPPPGLPPHLPPSPPASPPPTPAFPPPALAPPTAAAAHERHPHVRAHHSRRGRVSAQRVSALRFPSATTHAARSSGLACNRSHACPWGAGMHCSPRAALCTCLPGHTYDQSSAACAPSRTGASRMSARPLGRAAASSGGRRRGVRSASSPRAQSLRKGATSEALDIYSSMRLPARLMAKNFLSGFMLTIAVVLLLVGLASAACARLRCARRRYEHSLFRRALMPPGAPAGESTPSTPIRARA